ncbi:maleylpyruvate isomerase family mycothiol-dependent enzyme [Actinomadura flavalba]|uniref:maleylpyruvate isomerase family mycothiol-dependent enzyme n=1 Tax=Actinomadura flavalba TaxID=1120938 RepID=UPI000477ECEF|nr:maleylpyruvate isomerase family mycothiol-dependent enzyme [Actinomadura flavalba]
MDVRAATAAERGELASLLADLPADRWDEPTLCAGWRVREVVAHMTMPYRLSLPRVALGMVRAGGRFNRFADRDARAAAVAHSPGELAALLAANVDHPWTPPGSGPEAALAHDVIHGLDVTVALGLDRRVPPERVEVLLTDAARPRALKYFGVDLDGVELRADDLSWSSGAGAPLTGAAQDLLLALSGRRLPAGHLRGEPAARFTAAS